MATLVLGAVGTAFGGPIGGFLGATIGGAIDNFLLFPALFPSPRPEGPRIDGVNVSSGNEGTAMNWSLGPKIRVGGAVIWMSDLEERRVDSGKGGGKGMTNYEYYASMAISFGDAFPQGIHKVETILADVKKIYDFEPTNIYEEITIYDGTQSTPDPLMEAFLGENNVPCFKGQVYVVIKRLYLGEFGNRVPNFQAILVQQPECSVATAIGHILDRAGFEFSEDPTLSDYDTTRVSYCLRGVNFSGVVDTSSCLESITGTYNIGMQEVDGKFVFFDFGKELPINVLSSDIVSNGSSGFKFEDKYDNNLPDSINVKFISWETEAQPGSVIYRDHSKRINSEENQIEFDVPVVLTPDEASAVARRQYWQNIGESRSVEFSLPPKYGHIAGGDLIYIQRESNSFYVRAQSVEYGVNGQIDVSGFVTWPGIFDQIGDPLGTAYPTGGIVPIDLRAFVMDCPALTNAYTESPYYYFGTFSDGEPFRSIQSSLYISTDRSVDAVYTPVTSVTGLCFVGELIAINSNSYSDVGSTYWDGNTEIIVRCFDPTYTPTSVSEIDVLRLKKNIIAVRCINWQDGMPDWELIGFVNAEPVEGMPYHFKLTKLARGLRGTEKLSNWLTPNALVVFLSASATNTVSPFSLERSDFGWVAVPIWSTVDESSISGFLQTRVRSMKPFALSHPDVVKGPDSLAGEYPDFYSVSVYFSRRSHKVTDPFSASIDFGSDYIEDLTISYRIRRGDIPSKVISFVNNGPARVSNDVSFYGNAGDETRCVLVFDEAQREAIASVAEEFFPVQGEPSWTKNMSFWVDIWVNKNVGGKSDRLSVYVPSEAYFTD